MRKDFAAVMVALVLSVIAACVIVFQKVSINQSQFPRDVRTFTETEALDSWKLMQPPINTVDIAGIERDEALHILVDVNDDGRIDAEDSRARESGTTEIVRVDDAICNGRGGIYDHSQALDDDVQLLVVQLPTSSSPSDWLMIDIPLDVANTLVFYTSDLLTNKTVFSGPLPVGDFTFSEIPFGYVFLWMKAKERPKTEATFTIRLVRNEVEVARDSLALTVAGKLGDKNYFAGALDYLMERDRISGKSAKLFLDDSMCATAQGQETFRIVVMRHALAKMDVFETYYANHDLIHGRIQNIYQATEHNPNQDVVINGTFFHLELGGENHGKTVLGALVNNHELSPASGRHGWQRAYQESGVSGTPDWEYKSYCLTQPEDRPGCIELIEEPISSEPYVPKTQRDGISTLPHMAMGGLHQVHQFQFNSGYDLAMMGIVEASNTTDNSVENRKLIWLAATDTDSKRTTDRHGDGVFRDALRGSGVVIDEGDVRNGVGPGRCDMVYFDSANSVALAYKIDDEFIVPSAGGRHLPGAPNTLVNNYLMFSIAEQEKASRD